MAGPADNQRPAKKPRIDVSTELKAGIKLGELKVSQINTIFRSYGAIIFGAIESCFHHELHDGYVSLQSRLFNAQRPWLDNLVAFRNSHGASVPKPAVARRLGYLLAEIRQNPELSMDVKDAMQYQEATCIGIAAFSQHSSICQKEMKDWAGDIDPVEYFRRLVEASERHLKARKQSISNAPSSPKSVSSTIPMLPSIAIPSVVATIPDVRVTSSSKHEPFSDEYLQEKVSSFIMKRERLSKAIPWDQIGDHGCDLKEKLLRGYHAAQHARPEYRRTPPGILLHGDQGTGKTSIVESFAAHKDLVLFRVSGSVHGSLRGQSEKLIQYIFDAIRVAAAEKPCLLFFDEVDAFLGGLEKDSSTFEGMVKELWGDLISDDVPCFVFGATNRPWKINMGNYNRRFRLKVHTEIPSQEARAKIVRFALSRYWNEVTEQGSERIAAVSKGYSPSDIVYEIRDVAEKLLYDMTKAESWTMVQKAGKAVFVPATGNEIVAKKCKEDDLINPEPRPITTEMVMRQFESGLAKKTCSPVFEKKHKEWNAQW